jgi:hypothetical protein
VLTREEYALVPLSDPISSTLDLTSGESSGGTGESRAPYCRGTHGAPPPLPSPSYKKSVMYAKGRRKSAMDAKSGGSQRLKTKGYQGVRDGLTRRRK